MRAFIHKSVTVGLLVCMGSLVFAAEPARPGDANGNDNEGGSIVLGNVTNGDEPAAPAVEPVTTAKAGAEGLPEADAPKDPREQYRDKVMQEPEELHGATSAVSRRYKKVDLSTYRATMQIVPAQPAQ